MEIQGQIFAMYRPTLGFWYHNEVMLRRVIKNLPFIIVKLWKIRHAVYTNSQYSGAIVYSLQSLIIIKILYIIGKLMLS